MAACGHRADLRNCSRDLATSPRRSGPLVKTTLPAFTTSSAGTFCVPPRRRYRRRDAELRTSEVSRPRRPDEPPPLGSGWSRFYLFFAASSRAAVAIELTTQQVALLQGRLVTTCHTFRGSKNKTSSTSEGAGHQPQDRIITQRRASPMAGAKPCRSSCGPKRARRGAVAVFAGVVGCPNARTSELLPGCKRRGRRATWVLVRAMMLVVVWFVPPPKGVSCVWLARENAR